MKVSRVIIAVVALHVLVIGGIIVFEGCSRSQAPSAPPVASDETPAGQPTDMATAPQPGTPVAPAPEATPGLVPATPTVTQTAPAPVTPTAPATRTYAVKKGDTLWKIAKAEKTSFGELLKANKLTKQSVLKVGQKLQIPQKAEAPAMATAPAAAPVAGDTTVAATAPAAAGQGYTVKSGDSLWKIARANNTSVAALKQANNLSSDSLKVGQKLTLPAASAPAATAAAAADAAKPASTPITAAAVPSNYAYSHDPGTYTENGQTIHVVDSGESLSTIAKKYGVKADDLIKVNNLTKASHLQYGQRLVVPTAPVTPAASAPVSAISSGPALAAPVVTATTGSGN